MTRFVQQQQYVMVKFERNRNVEQAALVQDIAFTIGYPMNTNFVATVILVVFLYKYKYTFKLNNRNTCLVTAYPMRIVLVRFIAAIFHVCEKVLLFVLPAGEAPKSWCFKTRLQRKATAVTHLMSTEKPVA